MKYRYVEILHYPFQDAYQWPTPCSRPHYLDRGQINLPTHGSIVPVLLDSSVSY